MKFTEGLWRTKPGVALYCPVQVYDVKVEPNVLTVYGATRQIRHRVDTLSNPLLTIRFSSPMPNIIRVQIYHHRGYKPAKPFFQVNSDPNTRVEINNDEKVAMLTSGRLTVRVEKEGEWLVTFRDGEKIITSSGWRAMGFVDTPEGRYTREQLSLKVGECVYGLGERFTSFVKNGQTIDMWNEDAGTISQYAYKNIPFYLTNRGYGVFVNHPECVSFEIATENVERVQFSVPGEYLEYFLIYGPSPKEVLTRYTALTGRPELPPAWSFGLWLSTSFHTDYDERIIMDLVEGMVKRDIPLHVLHFDCFWMRAMHWCNFKWNEEIFPNPKEMISRLKSLGLHVCVWINPYISQKSELFEEAVEKGFLLKKENGEIWQTDEWQTGMGIVDFTNPEARRWFQEKLRELLDLGIDCFKTDFGERIPTDVVYHDGSDPVKMHNYYTYLYNETVFKVLEERFGEGGAVVFARSATVGCQKFPVHWSGDSVSTYESMAENLRGGLSLCLSGFGFWSHDIGGFLDNAISPDIYKRWCAFGLLSSHSRLHGNSCYHVPWVFDEEAVDVLRFFTKLKCRLMPYIFNAACEAHEKGIPVMRAMMLEFPEDPTCDYLDRQYMLGDSLLIAPVFSPEGIVDYYLPEGKWTNFITNNVLEGRRWVREKHGYLSLPIMVRPNSVIPVGANDKRPDYDYADGVTFHVFELQDGSRVSTRVPTVKGDTAMILEVSKDGNVIQVKAKGESKSWSVLLRNIYSVKYVEGGSAHGEEYGTRIIPEKEMLKIILSE
ncbi:MAG: alpha-xylosidase [Thermoproteota archaeon]|nr:alpha-xylosidase [Candidatus Brockarchaeota archaeon]